MATMFDLDNLQNQSLLNIPNDTGFAVRPDYSKAGSNMARLSGFDLKSEAELNAMNQAEVDKYSENRLAARNKGIGELLYMFSDALKGKDIQQGAQARQQNRMLMQQDQERIARQQQLNNLIPNLDLPEGMRALFPALSSAAQEKIIVESLSPGGGDTTLIGNVKYVDQLYTERDKYPKDSKAYKDLSNSIRNAEAGIGGYKYDVNRQAQIAAGTTAAEQGFIGQSVLTDAQINSDKAFGTWYTNEWLLKGGGSTEQTYLESLKGVRDVLVNAEKSGESISGVSQGVLSQFPIAQAFFNPEGAIVQDRIASVAQLSLKAILGGQFSEREGELLIQRAYNPLLSEAENTERLTQLINRIDKAENYKKAAAEYYEENKTIAGFKGQKYGEEEFRSDIESFYRQDMKLLDDNALEQEYLNTDSDSIYFKVLEEEVQKRQK